MNYHTKKRAAIEREYKAAKKEIHDEMIDDSGYVYCRGCGASTGRITWSHRIPRSRRPDLIADKDNIDPMCNQCHEWVEAGDYDQLANGKQIQLYILGMEPELAEIKEMRKDNLAA
jgi:5-methylcytosine-specific restriction endonuclease McrA